jgi:hypothetical protein
MEKEKKNHSRKNIPVIITFHSGERASI